MKNLNRFLLSNYLICIILILISSPDAFSQRMGYTDDFENGTLEFRWRRTTNNFPPYLIWRTVTPITYGLSEADGVLTIHYSRIEGTGAYDKFTFQPFRSIDVNANPRIRIDVRSELSTKICISPLYSMEPPSCEYIEKYIPGDNTWRTYTFMLTPAYYKKFGSVEAVDFYFDRDTSVEKAGKIEMDNFKLAWYLIKVSDPEASLSQGKDIHLTWKSSDEENTGTYRIYRGSTPDFELNENSQVAEITQAEFNDLNLEPYMHYFYRIVPVNKNGEVYFASAVVHAETFLPGKSPIISISSTNTNTVKKYEKFEVEIDMENVGIENPYDPADIDVYALFKSPSGKDIRINAFYDDYMGADQWKLRFSPNETGEYSYRLFVKDAGGIGKSAESKFTAIESEHHGWIKPATINPHYFMHDDGTSFYGVGVYSPWRNDMNRFNTYVEHKANLFAIWDITYGGFVNGTGLIEEELGRYNQLKLGRIDSMLSIFEQSGIKLMYALWPHDLFSETVWAAQWKINPYSRLIDVDDVYSDSLVWEYQKQKYRYMIARFAHSRSMGIWELINEMNGTDGWAHGRFQECYDWVEKCDKYFEENDPYNHPVTASFSGGFSEYREKLYTLNDIPNIHMYPAQGWELKYPDDTMRSAMYNYAWASRRFWDNFEKPAIFGEAGAGLAYYPVNEEKYHISYHNQIWASLSNGLASTPVWWDFPVLTDDDWDQLKILSEFVSDIDVANKPFKPLQMSAESLDIYSMGTQNEAFGWGRSVENDDISASEFIVRGLEDGSYQISWFDPWTGKPLATLSGKSKKGECSLIVPVLDKAHPDIVFKVVKK